MFTLSVDDRLSSWAQFRAHLETSPSPLEDTHEFWKSAPFIPYNNRIDPYHQRSWPSPWEIIVDNKYDDFTKAVMMGWTLGLLNRYSLSKIVLKTVVDNIRTINYNIVCVGDDWILNYADNGPVEAIKLPDYFLVENLVELTTPR